MVLQHAHRAIILKDYTKTRSAKSGRFETAQHFVSSSHITVKRRTSGFEQTRSSASVSKVLWQLVAS